MTDIPTLESIDANCGDYSERVCQVRMRTWLSFALPDVTAMRMEVEAAWSHVATQLHATCVSRTSRYDLSTVTSL